MKEVEYFFWRVYDPVRKRKYTTRWKMPSEEARELDSNAEPDLASREVRQFPETPQELIEHEKKTSRSTFPGAPRRYYDDKGNEI